MKQFIPIILIITFGSIAFSQTGPLETGLCYKIGVTQNGVYKLDGSFLKKKGVTIENLNPKNIHIYGNGAGMLPQANAISRPSGLIENSILVSNENKFSATDYLLFYGQAPHKVEYDTGNQAITQKTHLYSDTTYYFLVIDQKPGLRIENKENESGNSSKLINVFDDYHYHELDKKNIIGKSGRNWFGEEFGLNSSYTQIFDLKLNSVVPNSIVKLSAGIVGATVDEKSNFKILFNDKEILEISTGSINDYQYGAKGVFNEKSTSFIIENPATQKLEFKLDKNLLNTSHGYLDYFGLQTKRALLMDANTLQFRSFESFNHEYSTFSLKTNESKFAIWDITNPQNPKNQLFTNETNKSFTTKTKGILKEFFAFTDKNILDIGSFKAINNQNIRAYSPPDLLIITTKKFSAAAQKLADHRSKNDNLLAEVVDLEAIYNEFSSGMPDVTSIRDFTKYLYDQPNSKLKYLMLFADASYDIRNKENDVELNKILSDIIPAYQSRESLDNVKSFSSEDYYGFLENHEGEWLESENNNDNHTLDIGVGRLPVKTVEEAEQMVNKLIYYDNTQKTIGPWRTKIALASDDGDSNLHQNDSEDLANLMQQKGLEYRTDKIYVDAFPRLSGNANGKLSPEGSKKINNTFKKGALIFNYIGHGGPSNLSDEKILTREEIANWHNLANMPLMVTATCEFGRYDNPGEISGAEKALLNANGGAIALLTTTRPVYSITNKKINEAFYNAAFEPVSGQLPRLGDLLRPTKNNSFEFVYNRNFTLLGDPSMKLAYPEHKIVITERNGKHFTETADTLKALESITLKGEIRDYRDNNILKSFSGKVIIKLFDKETTLQTLGNNTNTPMNYKIFQDKLFEGEATITNGIFNISFTIPKDIQYKYGKGRIEMYAMNSDSTSDALGVFNKFLVGGTKSIEIVDKKGPTINASFQDKYSKIINTIRKNPKLTLNLKDESGININLSAVGHEITAILDGKIYVLNEYLIPVLDNNKEYNIQFQFFNLTVGQHNLEITAWDIYNNPATISLAFVVGENDSNELYHVFNFPNPVIDNTTIHVDHDFIGENLNAKVSILNRNGQIIDSFNYYIYESESPLNINIQRKIGKKSDFPKGIYPYQIELKTENTNKTAVGAGKLIVID